ncbi:MAG: DctP family TRAP transporter solute-binding subunit [Planctomycetes bacterium]|nr:DctP family TRAP transporter solute-binding subunit [Planctomycetota bacterium]
MKKILLLATLVCALTAAVGAGETIRLRFGFETPPADSQFVGADFMRQWVAENSGGRIEIQLFHSSQLGSGQDMLTQMRGGTLDMYMGGSGFFANLAQKLNIMDIPFLITDAKTADTLLEGDFGRLMLDEMDAYDMKGLAFWENGFRCLTNFRNPIRTLNDVKGLKLRLPGMPMHIEAWKILGTNPVPMPVSELYTALETRTVEGQDHPLNVTYSVKLYEVQKYISVSNHAYSPLILGMNLKRFQSLPADMQKIMLDGALAGARHQKKFIRENITQMLKEMADYGCEIVPAEEMDMKSFRDALGDQVRNIFLERHGGDTGAQWLKIIDDEIAKG